MGSKSSIWIISIALTLGLLLELGCSDDDVADPDNQAPVIQSVSAEPDTFVADDVVRVTVVASDPDGDPLSYDWEVHGTSFMAVFASGSMIDVSNCCHIEAIESGWVVALVSDDNDATTRDSVQVWVSPRE
ncbi:MAG: hypothetical protein ABIJ61_05415 [bacterium]